jgi:hypothetical protein
MVVVWLTMVTRARHLCIADPCVCSHLQWHGLLQARVRDTPFVVVGCRSDLRDCGVQCVDMQAAALVAEDIGAWGYIEVHVFCSSYSVPPCETDALCVWCVRVCAWPVLGKDGRQSQGAV